MEDINGSIQKVLEIQNLSVLFNNQVLAVDNLKIDVCKGELYCMLGANGAGKTTTVNTIFNFISPTTGKVFVNGIDIDKDPLRAKSNMAYVSENVALYENFTAIQNLDFFSKIGGKTHYTKSDYHDILSSVGLAKEAFDRRLNTFSKGMRQKCGIAIAVAKDADLIVLDEPTSGLDPVSGREFLDILKKLRQQGKAVLMTTHDIFRAREIADKIGIMLKGKLVKEIVGEEIKRIDLENIYIEYVSNKN